MDQTFKAYFVHGIPRLTLFEIHYKFYMYIIILSLFVEVCGPKVELTEIKIHCPVQGKNTALELRAQRI